MESPRILALLGVVTFAVYSVFSLDPGNVLPPASWGMLSLCSWLAWVVLRGWHNLNVWDKRQFIWGASSVLFFLQFLQYDAEFQGWGDVYFFCGRKLQYCNCNFKWNMQGWMKAVVLWNFVLSTALGIQRLAIQLGLNGLLPGEEVVTKESFISICWRLIPYWLNNWEQQWGAECSSMMFELPHFAVELLVILPCVQILCSRMKILALPLVNVVPPPQGQDQAELVRENYAPNILKGYWEHQPQQRKLVKRLRSNLQIMLFTVAVTTLAAGNALVVPLYLERQIGGHPWTMPVKNAGHDMTVQGNITWTLAQNVSAADAAIVEHRWMRYQSGASSCQSPQYFVRNMHKHADEITKMQDPAHMALIPLVESALAVMRLACEKYFVLISVFVSYLIFREPPAYARAVIRFNSRLSTIFQKVILYSFPAVCWIYGAGLIFSTFVSVVFWGAPALHMYESIKSSISVVRIKSLRPATAAEIERMGGNCAICWGQMLVPHEHPDQQHADSEDGTEHAAQGGQAASAQHGETEGSGASPAACSHDEQGQQELQHPAAESLAVATTNPQGVVQLGMEAGSSIQTRHSGEHGPGLQQPAMPGTADQQAGTQQQQPAPAHSADASDTDIVAEGWSLPCGHAYHHACLTQWLHQCHAQGLAPTCPMCQAAIQLEVGWRLPAWSKQEETNADDAANINQAGANQVDVAPVHDFALQPPVLQGQPGMHMLGLLDHQRELQELLHDMPQILPPENMQLVAEVQVLQQEQNNLLEQRRQLMVELEARQQQLREIQDQQRAMAHEQAQLQQQQAALMQELEALQQRRMQQELPEEQQQGQPQRQQQQPVNPTQAAAAAAYARARAHVEAARRGAANATPATEDTQPAAATREGSSSGSFTPHPAVSGEDGSAPSGLDASSSRSGDAGTSAQAGSVGVGPVAGLAAASTGPGPSLSSSGSGKSAAAGQSQGGCEHGSDVNGAHTAQQESGSTSGQASAGAAVQQQSATAAAGTQPGQKHSKHGKHGKPPVASATTSASAAKGGSSRAAEAVGSSHTDAASAQPAATAMQPPMSGTGAVQAAAKDAKRRFFFFKRRQ